MTTEQIAAQIEAIKQATKEACKSRESALKFLIDAGIIQEEENTTQYET